MQSKCLLIWITVLRFWLCNLNPILCYHSNNPYWFRWKYQKNIQFWLILYHFNTNLVSCTHDWDIFGCFMKALCDIFYLSNVHLFPDLNECTTGNHVCHHNASCTNTDGSYTCKCDSGYSGNGHNCSGKTIAIIWKSFKLIVLYLLYQEFICYSGFNHNLR